MPSIFAFIDPPELSCGCVASLVVLLGLMSFIGGMVVGGIVQKAFGG